MIHLLKNKLIYYVNKNADLSSWDNIREHYGAYSYLMFLCISANEINTTKSAKRVTEICAENHLENSEILEYVFSLPDADFFIEEILKIVHQVDNIPLNSLYQQYLTSDFIMTEDGIIFQKGKNHRDVLGAYYTHEEFAADITEKAVNDYINQNGVPHETLKIIDYSCGTGAFLIAALRLCKKRNISATIYGYDTDPIAILILRLRLIQEIKEDCTKVELQFGNPLLKGQKSSPLEKFRYATCGRYYNLAMGISTEEKMDIVLGNPPWEKIRFEEKKFLYHFLPSESVNTKKERENILNKINAKNRNYYKTLGKDYEEAKKQLKNNEFFKFSHAGELNTYALFTELAQKNIKNKGIASLIVKTSLVKLPIYRSFFAELLNGNLYELYMFTNRRKIFHIDSREEFSVIYITSGGKYDLTVALDLSDYENFFQAPKIIIDNNSLKRINPETGMMPNINNEDEFKFILDISKNNPTFGEEYNECKFGRLVHLTNHSDSISKRHYQGYLPIYEGKFIEQYCSQYATFKGMDDSEKYKNKASASLINDLSGHEYPESRYYIKQETWHKISNGFKPGYIVAWRSLTSATNRRTMLATILPLLPTCQSIQLLQMPDKKDMLLVLSLFNSITFDYIVRLKMAGLDLTQTIIRQIPIPRREKWNNSILYNGIHDTIESHILSRVKKIYEKDLKIQGVFENIPTYDISMNRKELIADIDKITGFLYGLTPEKIKKIALKFDKYYTKEETEDLF